MTNPTDTLIVDTSNGKLRGKRMGGVHAWHVWSPAADGRKRPVWVWIHGGAYDLGGSSQYLGHELAMQGDSWWRIPSASGAGPGRSATRCRADRSPGGGETGPVS